MKENLGSLKEAFKGADLYGSKLLRGLITVVFFLWSGSAVVLFTYQTPFESYPAFFISRPGALIAKGK